MFKDGGDAQDEERKDDEADEGWISVAVVLCSKYSQTIWLQDNRNYRLLELEWNEK
jgi:hypothetical protein